MAEKLPSSQETSSRPSPEKMAQSFAKLNKGLDVLAKESPVIRKALTMTQENEIDAFLKMATKVAHDPALEDHFYEYGIAVAGLCARAPKNEEFRSTLSLYKGPVQETAQIKSFYTVCQEYFARTLPASAKLIEHIPVPQVSPQLAKYLESCAQTPWGREINALELSRIGTSSIGGKPISWWIGYYAYEAQKSMGVQIKPDLLVAIRKQENGALPIAYGVLFPKNSVPSVKHPYLRQVKGCAQTVAHFIKTAPQNIPVYRSGKYTAEFLSYLQGKYAPHGVANDPTNLNKHWYNGVASSLKSFNNFS